MIVHNLQDLWEGAIVTLNNGNKVTVVGNDDIPESMKHEMVVVRDYEGNEFQVLVGEAFNPEHDPIWISEIHTEDNPTPASEELVLVEVDIFDEIFDGIDPDTFDGDILDLI